MKPELTKQDVSDICQALINKAQFQNIFRVQSEAHTHNGADAPRVKITDVSDSTAFVTDISTTVASGLIAQIPVTPRAYGGTIGSSGSYSVLPAGWSVTRVSLGDYVVTHSLGTTNYAVVANTTANLYPKITYLSTYCTANYFEVTATQNGTAADTTFTFVLAQA